MHCCVSRLPQVTYQNISVFFLLLRKIPVNWCKNNLYTLPYKKLRLIIRKIYVYLLPPTVKQCVNCPAPPCSANISLTPHCLHYQKSFTKKGKGSTASVFCSTQCIQCIYGTGKHCRPENSLWEHSLVWASPRWDRTQDHLKVGAILYGSWLFFISAAAAIPGVTIAVPNTANYFQVKVTTPAQGIEKSG